MTRVISHISTVILRVWISLWQLILIILVFIIIILIIILCFWNIVFSLTEVRHYTAHSRNSVFNIGTYLSSDFWFCNRTNIRTLYFLLRLKFFSFIRLIAIFVHSITIRIWSNFLLLFLTVVEHFHKVDIDITRYAADTSCLNSHIAGYLGSTSRLQHSIRHTIVAAVRLHRFFIPHSNASSHARFRETFRLTFINLIDALRLLAGVLIYGFLLIGSIFYRLRRHDWHNQ